MRALARASRLLERASEDLSLAHYRVLSAIAGGDERASRIARRLALGKPTISAAVEALHRRGLLERTEVDGDQRMIALRLTDEGERLLADVESSMIGWLDDVSDRAPDRDELLSALVILGDAIEAMQAERAATGR